MTGTSPQPNLLREFRRALEASPTLNPNRSDGEYQYWLDVGVILRCLLDERNDQEIIEILNSHDYKGSAYAPALRFLRRVSESTKR